MLIKTELKSHKSSADPEEVAHFNALADEWWKSDGAFKTVHAFNKTRTDYLAQHLPVLFGRDPNQEKPLQGLSIIDAGCGAGLVAEAIHDLGASVLGIDASERNILIAQKHAKEAGKDIQYRHILPEQLIQESMRYDLLLTLEVVEHVMDIELFLGSCAQLVKPSGAMIVGTINRTILSYIKAIIGAEYVLGWLPKGTHSWSKFVKPTEVETALDKYGFKAHTSCGVQLNPLTKKWYISNFMDTTYLQSFKV